MNKEFIEKLKYEVSTGEYSTIKTKDLEEILNYIDNSISTEVIEEKIELYKEIADEDNKDYFIKIDTLEELLKGK